MWGDREKKCGWEVKVPLHPVLCTQLPFLSPLFLPSQGHEWEGELLTGFWKGQT